MPVERVLRGTTYSWQGSEEELRVWVNYKKIKAQKLVELGYSVSWELDTENYLSIRSGMGDESNTFDATVKAFIARSRSGIRGGRISRFSLKAPDGQLYDYHELPDHPTALKMVNDIFLELG